MSKMIDRAGTALRRATILAMIGLTAGLAATAAAEAKSRTLSFYNLHTRESVTVTYKRNGRFLPEGMKTINWILRDWRQNEPTQMDPRLIDLVWTAYQQSGSNQPIHIISGYRAPETNKMLRSRTSGVAKNSQHKLGRALDFYLPDVPLKKLREIGLKMQIGGVGYYPTSGSPFVHLDVGNVRHWPRMSRSQLVALFPEGRTLHIPADGKPLPGYEQALASYKQRKDADSIQVANARDSNGPSLLARLFGVGADEEEDNAVAVAAPAPQRAIPQQSAPQRQPVRVAVIPTPRPALQAGVPLPVRTEGAAAAPVPPADIAPETQIAALAPADVPLPSFAPRPTAAGVPVTAGTDATATLLAAVEAGMDEPGLVAGGQLAYVPTPQERPSFEAVLDSVETAAEGEAPAADAAEILVAALQQSPDRVASAAVEETEPAKLPPEVAAIMSTKSEAAPTAPLLTTAATPAPTVKRVELTRLAAVESNGPRLQSGPVQQGKTGRLSRSAEPEAPAPSVVDIAEAIDARIEIASLVTSPRARAVRQPLGSPDATRLTTMAPTAVFTRGFAESAGGVDAARSFSGSAVRFLPVAKFDD